MILDDVTGPVREILEAVPDWKMVDMRRVIAKPDSPGHKTGDFPVEDMVNAILDTQELNTQREESGALAPEMVQFRNEMITPAMELLTNRLALNEYTQLIGASLYPIEGVFFKGYGHKDGMPLGVWKGWRSELPSVGNVREIETLDQLFSIFPELRNGGAYTYIGKGNALLNVRPDLRREIDDVLFGIYPDDDGEKIHKTAERNMGKVDDFLANKIICDAEAVAVIQYYQALEHLLTDPKLGVDHATYLKRIGIYGSDTKFWVPNTPTRTVVEGLDLSFGDLINPSGVETVTEPYGESSQKVADEIEYHNRLANLARLSRENNLASQVTGTDELEDVTDQVSTVETEAVNDVPEDGDGIPLIIDEREDSYPLPRETNLIGDASKREPTRYTLRELVSNHDWKGVRTKLSGLLGNERARFYSPIRPTSEENKVEVHRRVEESRRESTKLDLSDLPLEDRAYGHTQENIAFARRAQNFRYTRVFAEGDKLIGYFNRVDWRGFLSTLSKKGGHGVNGKPTSEENKVEVHRRVEESRRESTKLDLSDLPLSDQAYGHTKKNKLDAREAGEAWYIARGIFSEKYSDDCLGDFDIKRLDLRGIGSRLYQKVSNIPNIISELMKDPDDEKTVPVTKVDDVATKNKLAMWGARNKWPLTVGVVGAVAIGATTYAFFPGSNSQAPVTVVHTPEPVKPVVPIEQPKPVIKKVVDEPTPKPVQPAPVVAEPRPAAVVDCYTPEVSARILNDIACAGYLPNGNISLTRDNTSPGGESLWLHLFYGDPKNGYEGMLEFIDYAKENGLDKKDPCYHMNPLTGNIRRFVESHAAARFADDGPYVVENGIVKDRSGKPIDSIDYKGANESLCKGNASHNRGRRK